MQLPLPGFPEGSTRVGKYVSLLTKEGRTTYFVGEDNYFEHPIGDVPASHYALCVLIRNRHMRVCDAHRDLGISRRSLMNWLKKYDEEGSAAFFRVRGARGKPSVLTEDMVLKAEHLLASGLRVTEVARELGIQQSTLRKAVESGRVKRTDGADHAATEVAVASDKSERSALDAQMREGLGTACTRPAERMAASLGHIAGAAIHFEAAKSVHMGGLLVGLPALCDNGLLSGLGRLSLPKGYYTALHILLVMGYMALGRLRRPEDLRHVPPGELGRVVGLDRIPEVSTLREKIKQMAEGAEPWIKELAPMWMTADPSEAGYLYVDGHVRVYHGDKAKLPARYVSRDRLCLRGTTDYWVNDALGRPFFVVSNALNDGMGSVILDQIVPELLRCVPKQPTDEELEKDKLKYRFVMIFDRECSNYKIIKALWDKRIAVITYRKNVRDVWSESEFKPVEVPMPNGEVVTKSLAMRETVISSKDGSMPVLEVRCLSETGHQTAIITTARQLAAPVVAGRMFTRWCQENFFAYMMHHYDIDRLVEYGTEDIDGTLQVTNPAWRALDKEVKDTTRKLNKQRARWTSDLSTESESELDKKATQLLEIQNLETQRESLQLQRKNTPKKVAISTLPEQDRPTRLLPLTKQFTQAIKMIAYRAETALVQRLKKHIGKEADARALVRELFVTSADIFPDEKAGTLSVHLHRMASKTHDDAVEKLLEELNEMQFKHPKTNAIITYKLVTATP